MIHGPLSEDTFLLYAIKMYDNPSCKGINEFYEDLNRIKYIKRLFNKFDTKKILKDRLLLNHILTLSNVFGAEGCSRILFYKIETKYHSYLKTFLNFLDLTPKELPELDLDLIPLDHRILKRLEELKNELRQ
jgi:hypothetical protein